MSSIRLARLARPLVSAKRAGVSIGGSPAAASSRIAPARQGGSPSRRAPQSDGSPSLPGPARQPCARNGESPLALVVCGDDELRATLRTDIGSGWRTDAARDGFHGLACARTLVPEVILVHAEAGGRNGLSFLRVLRADIRTAHIPVLVLISDVSVEARVAALDQRADAVLALPVPPDLLQACARSLVATRRALQERWSRHAASAIAHASSAPAETAFLDRVRATIEAHMEATAFGSMALAESVGLSPRQLHRRLLALAGETPSDLIRRVRLERAAALLAGGTRSVKEVTHATGFASPSGFRNAFRAAYDVAPSDYRTDDASQTP